MYCRIINIGNSSAIFCTDGLNFGCFRVLETNTPWTVAGEGVTAAGLFYLLFVIVINCNFYI